MDFVKGYQLLKDEEQITMLRKLQYKAMLCEMINRQRQEVMNQQRQEVQLLLQRKKDRETLLAEKGEVFFFVGFPYSYR